MIPHFSFDNAQIGDIELTVEIPSWAKYTIVIVRATPLPDNRKSGVLMTANFIDSFDHIAEPNQPLSKSVQLGSFFYLKTSTKESNAEPLLTTVSMDVPAGTQRLSLKGHVWIQNNDAIVHDIWTLLVPDEGCSKDLNELPADIQAQIPAWALQPLSKLSTVTQPAEKGNSVPQTNWAIEREILPRNKGDRLVVSSYRHPSPKPANTTRVAMICDPFTFNSFSPEFDSIAVEPSTWQQQFEMFKPEILFCESTWAGVNPTTQPWRGKVYGSISFHYENRSTLFSIVDYCRKKGIPTVFWNKEDPTHHHDRVNDFVSTSAHFDYIFTTAEECLDSYRKFKDNDRVGVLPFAAQPRLFNPIEVETRKKRTVFAGSWYHIHEERAKRMKQGFDYVLQAGVPLAIYDRDFGTKNPDRQFPVEYSQFLYPPIPHERTADIYRQSSYGLNFNTVNSSHTMFARRVFELAASGTQIISDYSPGINQIYGDDVIYFDRLPVNLSELNPEDIRERSVRAMETTMRRHTYRHRFETILETLKFPFTSSRPKPTMLTVVSSKDQAQEAIGLFYRSRSYFKDLLLAVSEEVPTHEAGSFMSEFTSNFVSVISISLIRKENVAVSNFLSGPEVISVEAGSSSCPEIWEKLFLHGEYTHQPIKVSSEQSHAPRWSAGRLDGSAMLTSQDVLDFLLNPNDVRQYLEVSQ